MSQFFVISLCGLFFVGFGLSESSKILCPLNEVYSYDPICPPDTCCSLTKVYDCCNATSPPYKTGCKCKEGYYRLKENGPCVPACDCPQPPKCCPENEEYSDDPICPPDTCTSLTKEYDCCNATSPPYKTGCKCKKGYYRLKENGPCVPACDCPPPPKCCPENEEYSEDPICPPDTCSSLTKEYDCCNATSPPYKTGCKCKEGYYRLKENGPCVPACDCPPPPKCCPENEVYSDVPICPPDTCSSRSKKYDCCDAKSPPYKTGCKCKEGYYRLKENGPCVPACDCPNNPHYWGS